MNVYRVEGEGMHVYAGVNGRENIGLGSWYYYHLYMEETLVFVDQI